MHLQAHPCTARTMQAVKDDGIWFVSILWKDFNTLDADLCHTRTYRKSIRLLCTKQTNKTLGIRHDIRTKCPRGSDIKIGFRCQLGYSDRVSVCYQPKHQVLLKSIAGTVATV